MPTTKTATVGIQKDEEEWDDAPGTITISGDGITRRIYFEREDISMVVDLGDLMEAIKTEICGGNV